MGAAQHGQTLLVHVTLAYRRVQRHHHVARCRQRGAAHPLHLNIILLRRFQQTLPDAVLILHVRQVQGIHRYPGQQRIQAVGMVGVEMGDGYRLQPVDSHSGQLIRRHGARVDIAVGAAAVHQNGLSSE